MYRQVKAIIANIDFSTISESRKNELLVLTEYIRGKQQRNEEIHLNFICTHNSRRSQFSQLWAQVASSYYNIYSRCYSGGVEITEVNTRVIDSIERFGFHILRNGINNPHYTIKWTDKPEDVLLFSKVFDDSINPSEKFAAIMTCSHADVNCPLIPGAENRISIRHNDPKAFDDSPLESSMYDARSFEIASEMFYVFSLAKK